MRPALAVVAVILALVQQPATRPAPAASGDASVSVYFSPNGGAAAAVIHALSNARTSIDIAMYSITHVEISRAIIDAHRRGVRVRVVLDRTQSAGRYSSATPLHNASIEVMIDATAGLMHHKFCIVDGRTLLTGSFNWTKGGDEVNAENLLVLEDQPAVLDAFAAEFARVLAKARRYQPPG